MQEKSKYFHDNELIKYFFLVFVMIFFIILYVWQNIEVMKLKISYHDALKEQFDLANENDRLHYEIEKFKRMEYLEAYALEKGMRPITPSDFNTLEIKE